MASSWSRLRQLRGFFGLHNPSPAKQTRPSQRSQLAIESLEQRCLLDGGLYRTIDGTDNNLDNPEWGSSGIDLLRIAPAEYGDGFSTPAGSDRPSARVISNSLVDQGDEDIVSDRQLSAMIYAWGQFLDHDIDLTPNASPSQPFNIQVPTGDPSFDPAGTGTQVIRLKRSATDPATGTSTDNPLEQINVVTAWIDGSQIYGSDDVTASKLRTDQGGKLKTSPGTDGIIGTSDDLLPFNNSTYFPDGTLTMANDAHVVPDDQLFAAGDVRANENIELTSLHTLFVREHNRIADEIGKANPGLDDETVYQMARARVIGELEVITFKEWLPALLGPNALQPYRGYNATVNPGIANEFSTAAFRLGHSLLGDDVEFLNNKGLPTADEVSLSEAFFNPPLVSKNGIDSILKYLTSDPSSELDSTIVDSVRNFLFGPPGAGGLDLASLNIQRGRDHGLADYNTMREAYSLPRVTSFAQITSDTAVQGKLEELYGTVDNIDAWVGALAEDHVASGSTGPLIRKVLADQFQRLRDGDRFWYQATFSGQELRNLERTSLNDVIRRNTTLTNLQQDTFFFRTEISGSVLSAVSVRDHGRPTKPGIAGVTVELQDDAGTVLATTVTDNKGFYRFDTSNGLMATGEYHIEIVVPTGFTQKSPRLGTILISRGDEAVRGVNFVLASGAAGTTPGFVDQTYQCLLGRNPDASDQAFWSGQLARGGSRASIVTQIQKSPEYLANEVNALFQQTLHRDADLAAMTHFTRRLAEGGSAEQVAAQIAGSTEYLQTRANGQNSQFLTALFADALNRDIDPAAQAALARSLAQGTSRSAIAAAVFSSEEHRRSLVRGLYSDYLGRDADESGLAAFVAALASGATEHDVVASIMGSQEFAGS